MDSCSLSALSISDGEWLGSGWWWTSVPHLLSLFQMVNGWTVVGGGLMFFVCSLHCLMKLGRAVKEVQFIRLKGKIQVVFRWCKNYMSIHR